MSVLAGSDSPLQISQLPLVTWNSILGAQNSETVCNFFFDNFFWIIVCNWENSHNPLFSELNYASSRISLTNVTRQINRKKFL